MPAAEGQGLWWLVQERGAPVWSHLGPLFQTINLVQDSDLLFFPFPGEHGA